jgi:hypothetical protein
VLRTDHSLRRAGALEQIADERLVLAAVASVPAA